MARRRIGVWVGLALAALLLVVVARDPRTPEHGREMEAEPSPTATRRSVPSARPEVHDLAVAGRPGPIGGDDDDPSAPAPEPRVLIDASMREVRKALFTALGRCTTDPSKQGQIRSLIQVTVARGELTASDVKISGADDPSLVACLERAFLEVRLAMPHDQPDGAEWIVFAFGPPRVQ
jgi:hypothetical protein